LSLHSRVKKARFDRLKEVLKIFGDKQSNWSLMSLTTFEVADAVSPITFTEG
jgi:hypothetical protein